MKRINTTEILLIVVLVSWIASMNFAKLSALDYIGIASAVVFALLQLLRWKGGVEDDA
ncbi:hypothetical protein U7118_07710 [Bacillus subtilis]|uniref:hypothetical protein n=1 Tax=Bacillus subtilis TaxID=1423 RepID=UPI002417DA41|nr:hypothetical protein [Bacillus subtilis]WFO97857.1 hypothetical protein JEQ25_12565 [Bacillus subtilis]WNA14259.1 hypothetical protein phi182_91 [Bacillus phage phi18-2]WOF29623.1 hypothetical protein OEJ84_17135 [Bacillus subtilis]WRK89111.1 hypothetical protein U7118_07710 [Bacillus subtilis]